MSERPTVLVVDDEPDVLLLCRVNLEIEGFRVLEAADGEQAIAVLAASTPDVVLLDLALPRVDGWQVIEHLQGDPRTRDLPIVVLTGKTQLADQVRGWRAGVAEYVTKPFSPLSLSHVVHDVLATSPQELGERRRILLDELERSGQIALAPRRL